MMQRPHTTKNNNNRGRQKSLVSGSPNGAINLQDSFSRSEKSLRR